MRRLVVETSEQSVILEAGVPELGEGLCGG